MANWLFWVLTVVISLFAGAIFYFVLWFLFTRIKDIFVKKGIPKKRSEVTEHIKENREKYKAPNKQEVDKKEEEENERRKREKFREFEKLRRAELKERTGDSKPDNRRPNRTGPNEPKEVLPPSDDTRPKKSGDGVKKSKPRVKLDD